MNLKTLTTDESGKSQWVFTTKSVPVIGDTVSFACNGQGRGGHYNVTAKIIKINPKTLIVLEMEGSYRPGIEWRVNKADCCIER